MKGDLTVVRVHSGARVACGGLLLLLAACGGGGGGGSSAPDLSTASGLTVGPASLSFTAVQNGAIPPTQSVQITISHPNAALIGLGFPPGTVPPTWLDQSPSRFTGASNNWTFVAAILSTSLAPGTYTTTIRTAIADANQNILAYRDVPLSYTIQLPVGLVANPQSLTFSQLQGDAAPAMQTLGISDAANASYPWNASVVYQSGSGWLNVNGAGSASGATLPTSLSISINPSGALGTLNAVVRVTGNGNTLDVPVSYTVSEPQLTRSPAQLTFNASSQGTTPVNQDVTLSTQGNLPVNYATSVSYGAGANGWLTVPANGTAPGTVGVGVGTTNLAVGAYTATLTFTTATQVVSVAITYVVAASSLTFNPPSVAFTIDTASLPAALSQSVSIGATGAALSWTAASSQPWVTVSPTSGASGTSVTVGLDPAQLDTLDPGARSATVTFSYTPPGGGATSAPLSVSLNLLIPKVTSVNPYVATSSTSQEVILRGLGFNGAAGAAVSFDGNAVSSYTVVSDTELRVTHPSLAAGSYRVSIANQLGNPSIVRSTANLVVVNAPVHTATTLSYPDANPKSPLNIVYDAERQALLIGVGLPIAGAANGSIYRYAYSGSAWSVTPATQAVSEFRDLALSLDGKTLIAATNSSARQFDAVTLAPGISTDVTLFTLRFLSQLALANDGYAVFTTGINGSGFTETYRYSVADGVFSTSIASLYFAAPGASADGSRALLVQGGVSPAQPAYQYDASTGALSATGLASQANFPRPVLDRRATRILVGGASVYDSSLQKLGNIPSAFTVVLSPNGSRAYTSSGTVLRAYDLSGTLASPSTDVFPEIGTGTTLPSDPGLGRVMTVSPDGGTLFIAGDLGIVVVPAP